LAASVDLPLSALAKQVLQLAAEASENLNHPHTGTEHLLLGLLRQDQSLAGRVLRERGLDAKKVAALIKGGNVTPQTKGAGTPTAQYLRQLTALVEVLIRQGAFTREEFVEELASRYILPDLHATLHSLLGLLVRKGVINPEDQREIVGVRE